MSEPITPTPTRLKSLSDAATPGPWKVHQLKRVVFQGQEGPLMSYLLGHAGTPEGMRVSLGSERVADHEFVAALVNAFRSGELSLRSEMAQPDAGTEKLLRDLLDRGYKMHVMAGTTTRIAEQDGDQNDPLLAWLSDVRSVLYGKTKPEPKL